MANTVGAKLRGAADPGAPEVLYRRATGDLAGANLFGARDEPQLSRPPLVAQGRCACINNAGTGRLPRIRTRQENIPLQRTAAAAGMIRAPDRETNDDDGGPVLIHASPQLPGATER